MNDRMTAREVAEMLGVSTKWVYTHTKSGEIPSVRIGRKIFYSRRALLARVTDAA